MSRTRLVRGAGVALMLGMVLAGCSLSEGNKAGGPGKPVVLRMATVDGEPGYRPQVESLVKRVESLSQGNLRIEVVYGVGNFNPDAEQQVVRGVAAGTYDLGVVGTRVFDTLGVTSFQALTAPMLIDSYPLEQAVIDSDIPARMMRSLDKLHVTGLGVLEDGLRKPIAVEKPLLSPSDWRGITFAAFRSDEAFEAIRALGARPSDLFGPQLDQGLDSGQVQAFEKNLFVYNRLNMWNEAPYVTANVNLWPQTLAVIADPDRLGAMTSQQRDWLDRAVRDAARSTDMIDDDPGLISGLCAQGTRFANASGADIVGLKDAFAPVYASIENDPQTAAFIAEIERLKRQTPAGPPFAIQGSCTGPAPSPSSSPSPQPKTTDVTPLDGVWDVTYSRDELVAAHPDPSEVVPENYGHFTVAFHRGIWETQGTGQSPVSGTYAVDGNTITFHAPGPSGPEVWRYTWSVYRDTLTFQKLGGEAPDCSLSVSQGQCEPTGFVVKPWRRVSR